MRLRPYKDNLLYETSIKTQWFSFVYDLCTIYFTKKRGNTEMDGSEAFYKVKGCMCASFVDHVFGQEAPAAVKVIR